MAIEKTVVIIKKEEYDRLKKDHHTPLDLFIIEGIYYVIGTEDELITAKVKPLYTAD